ncbi:MAG TPA: hypothetical protein VLJ59_08130 [Mycobacteriales bacterium]|nr:hypothetical protein [Mycobacteriales bacterium]
MRTVAVFDIDGVVADVRHRLHFLDRKPKDWDGFFAAAGLDPPLLEGIALVRAALADHEVLWLTGRPERLRPVTTRWLASHDLPAESLRMRRDRDYRPARLAKRDELRTLAASRDIAMMVDDDPEVIAMLTAEGFPAQLADWVPHSSTLSAAQERDGRT